MSCTWTITQKMRLKELNSGYIEEKEFNSTKERDEAFRDAEKKLRIKNLQQLKTYCCEAGTPALCEIEKILSEKLKEEGFLQVVTPTIISKEMLAKMTVDNKHPLFSQVFWLDGNKCLRPMLAPNLYSVSKDLLRSVDKHIKLFEIGSCFRKESQGNTHLNEFTMLNLVEWGIPEEERNERLEELADLIMKAIGLDNYKLIKESSVVYGDTVDVMYKDIEVASGSMGPHFLDGAWGISSTWVGLGFGLERLIMLKNNGLNVKSYSKSISYINGIRLNL